MTSGDERLRVLLIEDSPGDARFIREMLSETAELSKRTSDQGAGLLGESTTENADSTPSVVHETSLSAGLGRLEAESFDVVLLDLNLPDSGGLETLSTLLDTVESVPVVVLTGVRDQEMGLEALDRGADEYLVKDEINADLLVRSVYHAIERKRHERELDQYRILFETVEDGVYILDDDERFLVANEAFASMLGYDTADLLGNRAADLIDQWIVSDDGPRTVEEAARTGTKQEITFRTADGRTITTATNFVEFPLGGGRTGHAGVVRDITERKEYERRLRTNRDQLAKINSLNELVREITHLAIESATREEVEDRVCKHLADSASNMSAWIGVLDRDDDRVVMRTGVGVTDDFAGVSLDDAESDVPGVIERAVETRELQVARRSTDAVGTDGWRAYGGGDDARSFAAVPVTHEGVLYGVLNVFSARREAFGVDERDIVSRLGEVVGHAIAAVERKQVLLADAVVELEFDVSDVVGAWGLDAPTEGTITVERTVPVGDRSYLQYGVVTDDAVPLLEAMEADLEHVESVSLFGEGYGELRFESRLSDPPLVTTIASHGGSIRRAVIEDGDYRLVVHFPPSADVRRLTDAVQEEFPDAVLATRKNLAREDSPPERLESALEEELTERQRTALETAYFSGYFAWPREQTAEEVADSMDISSPTFHHHLRVANEKLLAALFTDGDRTSK